jgi:two-component system, chemotaxis family, protein-glutamate methylesterase/glutaminase
MEKEQMIPGISLVVIGGSSGSLEAILNILPGLPDQFEIPILIILHRNSSQESVLADLLSHKSRLSVKEVEEKEFIRPGFLYLAPADFHVLIEKDGSFSLDYSEKINFSRPSIDVSFASAADIFEDALVCILLSGANTDGAEGLSYAKKRRGTTLVQDPEEAPVPYMPRTAIEMEMPTEILSSKGIVEYLAGLRYCRTIN